MRDRVPRAVPAIRFAILDTDLPDDPRFVRCAIYTRQSVVSDEATDPALTSCAIQRTLCTEFIRSMAWRWWYPIGERFDDKGRSGATVERPALERLMARILEGDIQRVIVYRLDRLTRRVSDWARLLTIFQRFNVGLTVVHGAIDAEAGSLAAVQLNMLATFAELERDMIRERIADARAAKKARGERSAGRVPLGYETDPRTKQLVVVEKEAAVVSWFFTEAAGGKSTSALVLEANRLKVRNKDGVSGAWSSRAVLRLLQNETYAGRRPDGAPAMHSALVPKEVFDRVQAAVAARRTRKTTARAKFDENFDPFILRGLLTCGACGRTMTTSMNGALTKQSEKEAPRYYRCRTAGCGGQLGAVELERIAHKAIAQPPDHWPERVKERLRVFAQVWEQFWPVNKRAAFAETFESMTWHTRPERLEMVLQTELRSDSPGEM